MRFYKYIIGIVCAAGLFLLSACNTTVSREEWVYAEPPLPIDTIRAEVKAVSGGILYPLSIMVSEDRLVVCQPDMEQMFSVYRLPDIDYLYSFGKKGQGPDEFATIYFKRIVPTDEGFKLYCNDRRIYHVSLDDGSVLNKEKIVSDYDLFNGFAVINDSLCCFTDMRGKDTPFLMYNSMSKTTEAIGEYPRWISGNSYEKNPMKKVIDSNGYVVAKDDGVFGRFFTVISIVSRYTVMTECCKKLSAQDEAPMKNREKEESVIPTSRRPSESIFIAFGAGKISRPPTTFKYGDGTEHP